MVVLSNGYTVDAPEHREECRQEASTCPARRRPVQGKQSEVAQGKALPSRTAVRCCQQGPEFSLATAVLFFIVMLLRLKLSKP
jgi:hypothetical protein